MLHKCIIFSLLASRAGWNGFTGRIWPAGRSLETPGSKVSPCQPNLFVISGILCVVSKTLEITRILEYFVVL